MYFSFLNLGAKIVNRFECLQFLPKNLAFWIFRLTFAPILVGMKVLVVTETDACCGPMAAAFLNDSSSSMEAVSVGRNPVSSVEPLLVMAMRECLVDLEGYVPKSLDEIDPKDFNVVYECPDLPCPTTIEACRELRDFIKNEAFLFFKKM